MSGIGAAGVEVTVQIDLSGTHYGGAPTWTDVSADVMTADDPISIPWGRQDWTSDVGPATCSFTLDNHDGRYTPGNPASPYYPNVRRRARCRVSATVTVGAGVLTFTDEADGSYAVDGPGETDVGDGTISFADGTFFDEGDYTLLYEADGAPLTIYLFDGLIDSWEASYEGGIYGETAVSATDMLGRLSSEVPLRSLLYEEILVDEPNIVYFLNDQGPTLADLTGTFPTLSATVGPGGPDIAYQNVTGPTGGAIQGDMDVTGVGLGGYFSFIAGVSFSISGGGAAEVFFATSATGFPAGLITDSETPVTIGITADGYIGDGTTTGPFVADGQVHQLVVVNGDGWYLDGTKIASKSVLQIDVLGLNLVGTMWCLAIYYGGKPSTSRLNQHRFAAVAGCAGENTGTHVIRLMNYRPNYGLVLDAGVGFVGVHATDGIDLQQALYDTAEAEGGVVWADGQGQINLRNRSHMFSPVPELTLDGTQEEVEATTVFRDDIQYVVNDVTITTPSGATQRYFDAGSVALDGDIAENLSLIIDTDAHALAAAKWRVQVGIQEQVAATQLDVNMLDMTDTSILVGVLQLVPLDVVAATGLPSSTTPAVEQFMVQGGTLTIGVNDFSASLFTTAVPAGDPY